MGCLVDFIGDSLPYLRQFDLIRLNDVGIDGFHFDSQFLRNVEDSLGLFIDASFLSHLLGAESVVRFNEAAVCRERGALATKHINCLLLNVPQLPEALILSFSNDLLRLILQHS